MNKDFFNNFELKGALNKFTEEYKGQYIKGKNSIFTSINKKIEWKVRMIKNVLIKNIAILLGVLIGCGGTVFAGNKIIENIWKKPEKVNPTYEITAETRSKNITIDEAKEIAINKLKEVGFNSTIIAQKEQKEYNTDKIEYIFTTNDEYQIIIEGNTGKFLSVENCKKFKQDFSTSYTKEEAKEIADKYFTQFKLDKSGFEFSKVQIDVGPDVEKGREQNRGNRLEVWYNKRYDNKISNEEYVVIVLDTGLKDRFECLRVRDEIFENNEYIITKDEAIIKAKEYDKNITNMEIIETKVEKKIVTMNDKAYSRQQNYEEYYAPMQNTNFDNSKYNYYDLDKKIRNAWVVVLKYDDKYFKNNVIKRYTEGAFTYYIDATTGEVIGGENLDGLVNSF